MPAFKNYLPSIYAKLCRHNFIATGAFDPSIASDSSTQMIFSLIPHHDFVIIFTSIFSSNLSTVQFAEELCLWFYLHADPLEKRRRVDPQVHAVSLLLPHRAIPRASITAHPRHRPRVADRDRYTTRLCSGPNGR